MNRFPTGARTALTLALALTPAFAQASAPAMRQAFKPRHMSAEELAAVPRDGTHLLLHGAVFDPTVSAPDLSLIGLPRGGETSIGIVQLQPGRLDEKERLEKQGIAFVGYVPDNGFLFRLTSEAR